MDFTTIGYYKCTLDEQTSGIAGETMQIHQFIPTITPGDAASNEALAIRDILRRNGFQSNIYAKFIHPAMLGSARPHFLYRGSKENILIYHFAIGGSTFSDFILKLPDVKILRYHNITPPHFFSPYDEKTAYKCQKGLDELATFRGRFILGLGHSPYNCRAMDEAGFERTQVIPFVVDFSKYTSIDEGLNRALRADSCIKIIFVGRIAPNKKQDDLIRIFDHYHRHFNQSSRLFLIGQKQIRGYLKELEDRARSRGLSDEVIFTGKVSDKRLHAYYRNADVYVCMSEHEGFGVPLLEAMFFNIPVIAYDFSAVRDTLGDAGILVKDKDHETVAQLIHKVTLDTSFRKNILEKQRERLVLFQRENTERKLLEIIRKIRSSE